MGNDPGSPVLRIDVGDNHVELQLRHDPSDALVRMEAGRPEEMGPLAHDLGDCACAVLDLASGPRHRDLGQPGMGHGVAPDLVARLQDRRTSSGRSRTR